MFFWMLLLKKDAEALISNIGLMDVTSLSMSVTLCCFSIMYLLIQDLFDPKIINK